jgi:hypothetical protein
MGAIGELIKLLAYLLLSKYFFFNNLRSHPKKVVLFYLIPEMVLTRHSLFNRRISTRQTENPTNNILSVDFQVRSR